MAVVQSLLPADMSTLGDLQRVQLSVQGGNAESFFAVWVRYEGNDNEILIFDGTSFREPFVTNSTIARPKGDDSLVNFSIVPELGWQGSIPEFRIQGYPAVS